MPGLLDTLIQSIQDLNPEWTKDRLKTAGGLLADFTPVVGDVKSAYEGVEAAKKGDYLGAGLGALGALPLVPNLAGMFIGKGAKTWDAVMASKAMDMEKAGADPRTIWKETGNWKGPDGHWRQEIPDNKATTQPDGVLHRAIDKKAINEGAPTSMPQWVYMDHPELYNAYDGAKKINIKPTDDFSGGGYYNDAGTIGISAFGNNPKSTNLHELQHVIQQREGWARGGSPEWIADERNRLIARIGFLNSELSQAAKSLDKFPKGSPEWKQARETYDSAIAEKMRMNPTLVQSDSYDGYKRLAGEAEARATQSRMNLDANQRRALFPEDSYDVPIDQLIIRGLLQ